MTSFFVHGCRTWTQLLPKGNNTTRQKPTEPRADLNCNFPTDGLTGSNGKQAVPADWRWHPTGSARKQAVPANRQCPQTGSARRLAVAADWRWQQTGDLRLCHCPSSAARHQLPVISCPSSAAAQPSRKEHVGGSDHANPNQSCIVLWCLNALRSLPRFSSAHPLLEANHKVDQRAGPQDQ